MPTTGTDKVTSSHCQERWNDSFDKGAATHSKMNDKTFTSISPRHVH